MYKSSDGLSETDEEIDRLYVDETKPNIEETLHQYKDGIVLDKFSNIGATNDLIESKFESGLIQSN